MTYNEFNVFCAGLPAISYVVQWGGAHVWKVGAKVFAIGGWEDRSEDEGGGEAAFVFKASDIAYEMLRDQPGLRPAPYFAARGMKWLQHYARPGLDDAALRDYLRQSHRLVAAGLTKKSQRALGLDRP